VFPPFVIVRHAHPAAARIGVAYCVVEAAARQVFTDAGYRLDCQGSCQPHSTDHSLGLDIHETTYIVVGNDTSLAEGMCFSIEPMLCIPGKRGVWPADVVFKM
jgi:Xaa-Pro dipeptidase